MQFNLTLSPSQLEIILKPGARLTQAYDVVNNSNNTLILSTSVEPWRPTDNQGSITYDQVSPNPDIQFSLANADLKIGQNFRLEPGAKRQLVLKISSNSTTAVGDNYYTFFISQESTVANTPQAFGKIGSHILISSSNSDTPKQNISINNFITTPRFKDVFFTPIRFTGLITNNSDFYLRPEGKLTLTKNNLVVKELTLAPQNVLAHHSRTIQCTDNQHNVIPCSVTPPFWPGLYTATLSTQNAATSVSFFVFPYYIAFCLILIGLISALLLRLRHR